MCSRDLETWDIRFLSSCILRSASSDYLFTESDFLFTKPPEGIRKIDQSLVPSQKVFQGPKDMMAWFLEQLCPHEITQRLFVYRIRFSVYRNARRRPENIALSWPHIQIGTMTLNSDGFTQFGAFTNRSARFLIYCLQDPIFCLHGRNRHLQNSG